MRPITFSCRAAMPIKPAEFAARMLDLEEWKRFRGFAFIPAIRSAEFESRTDDVVGTRIRVTNADGSRHVEEFVEWRPDSRLRLRMGDFSPPLSRLATHFDETFDFETDVERTHVVRTIAIYPKSRLARPLLLLISIALKQAISRHLRDLASA